MRKKLFFAVFLITIIQYTFGQTMYLYLKPNTEKPSVTQSGIDFKNNEINTLISGLSTRPALKHPEKYHSASADRLKRTYLIDISSIEASTRLSLVSSLENNLIVEKVEIEYPSILTCDPPNDPTEADWNKDRHDITCVREAHCLTQGDASISIAVRDNGFIENHPEHEGKLVYVEPGAFNGECHGTQTSITAAGATNNGFGLSSSGYDCSLMLYLWDDFVDDYLDLATRGARIVNNSYIYCGAITAHQDVINMVTEMGVIVVASAGNGVGTGCGTYNNSNYILNGNNYCYPASYDNVISVSSVSHNKCMETTYNFWDPAGYDPPLHHTQNDKVDFLAQGFYVVTGNCEQDANGTFGGQAISYGTSIAGPHIAGIIGLVLSVNPCLNYNDVLNILAASSEDITGICNNAAYYPNGNAPGIPCAETAVIMAQNYQGPDVVIDVDTEWDQRFVSGNVIIKNNATLSVFGTVSLGQNSRIIVERGGKLILDGGTLTSCSDKWEGVIVEGFGSSISQDQAGLVELKNNATIENAKVAISCSPSHIPWPNYDYYGGLIKAENSTISNCNKGVEFMKYGVNNIEDDSYFTNVTFSGCKNGVTLWANNGVEFTNCTFSSILENGILPLDSRAVITGCTFDDVKTGVNVHSTMPIPFSTEIHSNNFYTSDEGVKANATANSTSLDIFNNNFFGSYFGLLMSGASHYHVQKNDFTNQNTSSIFYNTNLGIDDQMIDNNISNSEVGSLANKSNYTVYVDNCFGYNGNADLNISGASIFPFQLDTEQEDEAAGNCFTKNSTKDIYTSNNIHFNYYIKQRELNDCKIPTNPGPNTPNGNYSLFSANSDDDSDCGSITGPGIIFVKYRKCPVPKTKAELLQAINDLKALIAFYSQTAGENSYHYYLVKKYKACLKRLQVSVPAVYKLEAFPNWRQEAISYVNNETDFQVKAFAYGLMVENNEYSNARNWLYGLNRNTEEIQDFYTIQNINLDYLENRDHYQISNANKTLLYDLGRKDIPYNGFARSLHFVLTGEEVPIDLDYGGQPTTPRSKVSKQDWIIEQYPNPVSGQEYSINISSPNPNYKFDVNIYDIHGKSIFKSSYKGSNELKIDNSNWASGIYFVKISNQNEILSVSKLIKI